MIGEPEYERWHASAVDALENAVAGLERGAFHWACFLSEQAAQFAVKASSTASGLERGGTTSSTWVNAWRRCRTRRPPRM